MEILAEVTTGAVIEVPEPALPEVTLALPTMWVSTLAELSGTKEALAGVVA